MKKITKIFEIDYNLHWDGSVEIEEIERDLAAIKKLGATHVEFESNTIYDSTILDVTAISIRKENDDEYHERIKLEKEKQDEIICNELSELKRLQKKYGA